MKLTKGFKNLHAGKAQTLTITKVVYDEKFDKMRVHFKDEEGGTGIEQLMFVSKDDKPNEVALNIFSTIVKCALHDWSLEEIDDFDALVGCQVIADVTEDEVEMKNGEVRVFTHLRNYKEAPAAEEDFDLEGIL